jgi:hypothetical protein
MTQKVVIYLNGPIGSGKDTLGNLLVEILASRGISARTEQFKESLYDLATHIASLPRDLFLWHATDRKLKESPFFMLPKNYVEGTPSYGMYFSPRDWLIHVSERVAKPLLGKGVFGAHTAGRVLPFFTSTSNTAVVVITDSGFEEEKQELDKHLTELLGSSYTSHLVRLTREGTDFSKDSRSYLKDPTAIVNNSGSIEDLECIARQLLGDLNV